MFPSLPPSLLPSFWLSSKQPCIDSNRYWCVCVYVYPGKCLKEKLIFFSPTFCNLTLSPALFRSANPQAPSAQSCAHGIIIASFSKQENEAQSPLNDSPVVAWLQRIQTRTPACPLTWSRDAPSLSTTQGTVAPLLSPAALPLACGYGKTGGTSPTLHICEPSSNDQINGRVQIRN